MNHKSKPLNINQMKKNWHQNMEKPEKKMRIFNKGGTSSLKGKIIIDKTTYINYDYTGESSKTKLTEKKGNHIDRDKFELSSYPILNNIINEIPKDTKNLKNKDLFLMRDLDEAIMWNGKEFQFFV